MESLSHAADERKSVGWDKFHVKKVGSAHHRVLTGILVGEVPPY